MSENLREALAYAVRLDNKKNVLHEIDGETYYDRNIADLAKVKPTSYANTLVVNTLTGLVDYLKSKFDQEIIDEPDQLLINIEGPEEVTVYSQLNAERRRESLVSAKINMDRFPYGRFQDSERFIINIQSLFARDLDAEAILKCASAIRIEGGGDLVDDGVSQIATVRQGAGAVARAEVPSPAALRPFRTFLEVEQPESPFIFRVNKQGECALFEADGGMWRTFAMQSIKEYLETELKDELGTDYLTIIA